MPLYLYAQGYNELRFDLQFGGKNYFQLYSNFSVEDELSKYRLSVNGTSGTAGDGFSIHRGCQFSTYDNDNDESPGQCATVSHGAWWYYSCYKSNLNGQWTEMVWGALNYTTPLNSTEMKIRQ